MKYIKIQYFQKYNFYTHNPNYWAFNKKIIQHILHSKTIKTLFELLYPKYDYLFDKKENIDKLIESIIFIPYDLYNSYGITFRKELIIFIGGLFENFSKSMHYLSKSSCFIILGIYEGLAIGLLVFIVFSTKIILYLIVLSLIKKLIKN